MAGAEEGQDVCSGLLCGGCDFGQLRRPMLKRLFANAFCAEVVLADDGGRGCRNGCLRGSFCRVAEMVCAVGIYAHIQYDMRFVRDFFSLFFCQTGKYGYICNRFSRNQPGWRNR